MSAYAQLLDTYTQQHGQGASPDRDPEARAAVDAALEALHKTCEAVDSDLAGTVTETEAEAKTKLAHAQAGTLATALEAAQRGDAAAIAQATDPGKVAAAAVIQKRADTALAANVNGLADDMAAALAKASGGGKADPESTEDRTAEALKAVSARLQTLAPARPDDLEAELEEDEVLSGACDEGDLL